ncbi:glycoside hydrolase family 35 protein [Colletotrichum truncatum]|uniref:Glycoside hydrolase family 35 protein n=1 Tax=Colletotrichum truncatum TaxID=5467 RepID=A0ACC3Z0Z0_COLTU|nr:glycoside hydrolase family 35 protein [Colletotrichum truncatum]KAF6800490.1 glycoside hydrolase family 35 protein [Colletotrichum truncatum]
MRLSVLQIFSLALGYAFAYSGAIAGRPSSIIVDAHKRERLQDVVTWDEYSLFIRGERVMIYSGEIHPFRIPSPSLYLDLFQKAKALGLNTISFYVDWALVEGKAGNFSAEGIFDLQPFFDAATRAGIYLIARPGPYINAEVSGGGFPGWLTRLQARLRTSEPEFLSATDNYMARVCDIIAKAQITNGGPVILFQPENEYTNFEKERKPDGEYFQYVIDQARNAGIVVPMISNDARPEGHNAPGMGIGSVDIYGHDDYPLGFDCGHPDVWPADRLPTKYRQRHLQQSPDTPYSILEFQGGSFDPWGGQGFEQCAALVNHEYERVFYKNNMAAGVSIFNVYMLFGGTNWGNLGHPGGYTSYDYGAAIKEDRSLTREKFSELKLQAQFLKVSPSYLTARPRNMTRGFYSTNTNVVVTPLLGNNTGSYFVVRHSDYNSTATTYYTLRLPTSEGVIAIPQFPSQLQIGRRDSKIHVVDYRVGNMTLLYSTAEIYTWKQFPDKTVLLVYGGPGEIHEMVIKTTASPLLIEGSNVNQNYLNGNLMLTWRTSTSRRVIRVGHLYVYLLDRNSAYNYWVPDMPGKGGQPAYGTSLMNPDSLILRGGYLIRSISIQGETLKIRADLNQTTELEIIGVGPGTTKLEMNGISIQYMQNNLSNWVANTSLVDNKPAVPELAALRWVYMDSLPEISPGYNDSAWTIANHNTSNNTVANITTPVSLFTSDYGFHAGTIIFRGYFTANGTENTFNITTQGGSAFASSVWLNDTFLGSFSNGPDASGDNNANYTLPELTVNATYVLTILVDTTGLEENFIIATDTMKIARGIMDYSITSPSGSQTNITTWKLTGNLGGEEYADRFRGPLNEGGLFFERQGYHIPSPPYSAFTLRSPFDGTNAPGVSFYATNLTLDLLARDLDIPLSFVFDSITTDSGTIGAYRAILYVNGFQYGRYASNIGPQTRFPVPEGILRYQGNNWIGLAVWALEKGGAKVKNFRLEVDGTPVTTGREDVEIVEGPGWTKRAGAY